MQNHSNLEHGVGVGGRVVKATSLATSSLVSGGSLTQSLAEVTPQCPLVGRDAVSLPFHVLVSPLAATFLDNQEKRCTFDGEQQKSTSPAFPIWAHFLTLTTSPRGSSLDSPAFALGH